MIEKFDEILKAKKAPNRLGAFYHN